MRKVVLGTALTVALLLPQLASADVLIILTTFNLPRHGIVRGHGSGSNMPVYLVPVRDAPHRHTRDGTSYEPQVKRPPGPPFVFLGGLHNYRDVFRHQAFSFRVPAVVKPGLYRVYLYCRACGGSLIVSGLSYSGQVLRIYQD
jgi:hypothetical protein